MPVLTRNGARRALKQKAHRARTLMVSKGYHFLADCSIGYVEKECNLLTRRRNPPFELTALLFLPVIDGVPDKENPVFTGCIHVLEEVCERCDVGGEEPQTEAEKKEKSARIVADCFKHIWNCHPYIQGVESA